MTSSSIAPAIESGKPPVHVAIIMDGNGRWAKARGLPRTAGHKKGAEALRELLKNARNSGVKHLTVYAFSSENWRRAPDEVSDLMQLLKLYLTKEIKSLNENRIRLQFIGDRAMLAEDIRTLMEKGEALTRAHTDFSLTVALSYGSRQEILRAARVLAQRVKQGELPAEAITEELFAGVLDTKGMPEPDLLIRTGGEQRLSNFLLWQSAYTELYFTPVLWPDFSAEHFQQALTEFTSRERRYGNTN